MPKNGHLSMGVPERFRTACESGDYKTAAAELASHCRAHAPENADTDEWQSQVEQLAKACAADDRESIWEWFKTTYPRAMAMVPATHKHQFTHAVERSFKRTAEC